MIAFRLNPTIIIDIYVIVLRNNDSEIRNNKDNRFIMNGNRGCYGREDYELRNGFAWR